MSGTRRFTVSVLFTALALLFALTVYPLAAGAAAIDMDGRVTMSFDAPTLTPGAVRYEAEAYSVVSGPAPESAVRPLPGGDITVIWHNENAADPAASYTEYIINAPVSGAYDIVIALTAVQASPAAGQRGVGWQLDSGDKYQADIFPLLSKSYSYTDGGYRLGYISGITCMLTAGEHTFRLYYHETMLKAGRTNIDGFWLMQRAAATAPGTVTGTAPASSPAPGSEPGNAPLTSDDGLRVLLCAVAALGAALLLAAGGISQRRDER